MTDKLNNNKTLKELGKEADNAGTTYNEARKSLLAEGKSFRQTYKILENLPVCKAYIHARMDYIAAYKRTHGLTIKKLQKD